VSNFAFNNQIVIFELRIEPQQQSSLVNQYASITTLSDGHILIEIPDYRIKTEIQKLQRLGVKILDIYPIDSDKYRQIITEAPDFISSVSASPSSDQSSVSVALTVEPESLTPPSPSPSTSEHQDQLIDPNTPWWVEILTEYPRCLYYFGPFDSEAEARYHQSGYEEDLILEGAKGINMTIKQCSPQILTQEL
jgi:hypothetical protein